MPIIIPETHCEPATLRRCSVTRTQSRHDLIGGGAAGALRHGRRGCRQRGAIRVSQLLGAAAGGEPAAGRQCQLGAGHRAEPGEQGARWAGLVGASCFSGSVCAGDSRAGYPASRSPARCSMRALQRVPRSQISRAHPGHNAGYGEGTSAVLSALSGDDETALSAAEAAGGAGGSLPRCTAPC
jgi:hypothetical protein